MEHDSGLLRYDFQRGGLDKAANRALLGAIELNAPLIYLLGVQKSRYQPIFPVWATKLDDRSVGLAGADYESASANPQELGLLELSDSIQREYVRVQVVRHRHQASFAKRVKLAHGECCALTGSPVVFLLDAAHIIPDSSAVPASVDNGICMSGLHHAAFDANLMGIDPDRRIHVSGALLQRNGGNLLQDSKALDKREL